MNNLLILLALALAPAPSALSIIQPAPAVQPVSVVRNYGMQEFVNPRYEDDYTATMAIQPADYSKQTTLNGLFMQDATIKLQGE